MPRIIREHRITCSDINTEEAERLFADGTKVDVFYSDPPWGDGTMKYWCTMNRKQTGADFRAVTYKALIDRLVELMGNHCSPGAHVFIETGLRWERETMEALPLHNKRRFTLVYDGGRRENVMLYGTMSPDTPPMKFDPTGMTGRAVARDCIASVATLGGVVFDPCCGKGYTANAAMKAGMRFFGNEFNEKRLQETIKRLEKF